MMRFFQTPDGGEIAPLEPGQDPFRAQLETLVYLSLFGGNEDDPGGSDRTHQWWGNFGEPDSTRQYRSETQALLRGLPRTTANLRRIEDAIRRDLTRPLEAAAAKLESVSVAIRQRNRLHITLTISVQGHRPTEALELETSWPN